MNERVVIQKPGGLDQIAVVEEPEPEPRHGEVKVRIQAAGVAFTDILFRHGIGVRASAFPFTPGWDFVGVIEKAGPGTTKYAVGDRVAGAPIRGGNQRFICALENELFSIPPDVSPVDVSGLLLNYTTAYQLLSRVVHAKRGDAVLMHGAAGGVGTAMLQIARLIGVKVYGTVSTGKVDVVQQMGGIPIDYTRTDFVRELHALEPRGVSAVFDPIGAGHLRRSYRVLAEHGTLAVFGVSSAVYLGRNPTLGLAETMINFIMLRLRPGSKRVVTRSIDIAKRKRPDEFRQDVHTLLSMLQQGVIAPQIADVLPLRDARHAHELLEGRRVVGKIVLQP